MPTTILVTGGAGFIGSHLSTCLLMRGYRVIILDNFNDFYSPSFKRRNIEELKKDLPGKAADSLIVLEGDIRTFSFDHLKLHTHKIDTIVHLAAMAGVRPSLQNPIYYQDVNVLGTQYMLEIARAANTAKFIFASSSSVYGINPNVPWKESDTVLQPISPYAASKVSGELLGSVYSHLYGITFTALRFFTVYGPRQRPDLAIAKFIGKALNGEPIDVYGDGSSARDYTYVDDIVSSIVSSIELELPQYSIINVGNNTPIPLYALIETIEKATQRVITRQTKPEQPGDVPKTYADISKAQELLGYLPKTTLEEGVKQQVEWFRRDH